MSYSDVIKPVKDLLNKGYDVETKKLQVKTKTVDGVAVTFDGEMQNTVLGSLAFKSSNSSFSLDKLAVNSAGRFNLETSCSSIIDDVKFTLKAEDGLAGNKMGGGVYKAAANVEAAYTASDFTFNTALDLLGGPSVTFSGLGLYEGTLLGGTVGVDTGVDAGTGFKVTDFGGCVGYKGADFTAVVVASKKCTDFSVNVFQQVSASTSLAAQATRNAKAATSMTVGASHKLDADTVLQAKVNANADLSASLKQNLGALTVTAAGQVNTISLANPKFGLNFVLNL